MTTYPKLISKVCQTERTKELVSIAIPVLIRWAKNGITTNTYGDLIKELGMTRFSGIGHTLGYIEDVIAELRKETGENIPTLNALVRGKNGLPSYGFEYVNEHYGMMSLQDKRRYVDGVNSETIKYPSWDIVLQALCLKPSIVNSKTDEGAIRKGHFIGSGEGTQHKALKEYILNHPEAIGLRNISKRDNEFILLSGDRLDVYFEQKDGSRIAVEVKSIISSDDDILRGIYQCVKYKAVLEAENRTHGFFGKTQAVLIIEGILSVSNQQVKDLLGINVIEHFTKD